MSLSVDGVWKVNTWDQTVWADGVWREGEAAVAVVTFWKNRMEGRIMGTYHIQAGIFHRKNR